MSPWAPIPALLTRMSMPPSASAADVTAVSTEAVSATSQCTGIVPGGLVDGSRSSTATAAPRSSSSRAVAAPMPEAPPVITARSPPSSAPISRLRSDVGAAHDAVSLPAEPLDLDLDDVAAGEVGEPAGEPDALGRAGD